MQDAAITWFRLLRKLDYNINWADVENSTEVLNQKEYNSVFGKSNLFDNGWATKHAVLVNAVLTRFQTKYVESMVDKMQAEQTPLTKASLATIQQATIDETEEKTTSVFSVSTYIHRMSKARQQWFCVVCRSGAQRFEHWVKLKCDHRLHAWCFDRWVQTSTHAALSLV